jgi:hypothetical protein
MSKFKLILALTFAGLAMAATPIKDLVLQSNMDAAGFNITNAGDISNGDEVISMDGGNVHINPANADSDFNVNGTAGTAFSVDASEDLVRIGTHGFVSANTNDVVLHGSVEFEDGPVSLASNVITQVGSLQFSGGSGDQGTLSWNADEETIDLNENGTTLQLGQELHIHVRNDTGTTITNGTVVAFAGTIGASSRLKAELFTADGNTQLSYLLGVATENISNGADGKVTSFGKVRDIDTSAWPEGTALYASSTTAGGFVTNAPASPAQAVIIAYVINSHASTGSIEVILDHHNENGEGDSPWSTADSGATLYATNDVVEIRGSGLASNADQFVISNDVSGVVLSVDEDGDTGFRKWSSLAGAEDQSKLQFISALDFRFTVDYDVYFKVAGSTTEKMTFNPDQKDLDFQWSGDTTANLLYIDGGEDSVAIHTNVPPAGYGFAVATNTIFTATGAVSAVVIEDVMQMEPRASAPTNSITAGMIFYHSSSNKLFCYDGSVWNALW